MNHCRNLLLIAHAFPPSGGAGVRRVLKMVRYFSGAGWTITALAPKRGEYFAYPYDPSLQTQVPTTVKVIESFTPESIAMTPVVVEDRGSSRLTPAKKSTGLRTLYRSIYKATGPFVAIPESAIMWLPFAVWQGLRHIRRNRVDAIFATAPPFSALLIGTALSRLTGVPLVAEFRDAWIAEPARSRRQSVWRRQVEALQEAWVIRGSDVVVSVTEGVSRDFAHRYPNAERRNKFVTIPNGYDTDDRHLPSDVETPMGSTDDGQQYHIVHTGTLSGVRTPIHFLRALARLVDARPSLRSLLRVHFVGRCQRFDDGSIVEDQVNSLGLHDIVHIVGFVSREESLAWQRKADLLLLLVGVVPPEEVHRYGLAAKVFDYTLAERPILAISDEGPTAEYVRAAGIGEVISHQDPAGIVDVLERALVGNSHYAPDHDFIGAYDYHRLMSRLQHELIIRLGI